MKRNLLRYHREIFFPESFEQAMGELLKQIKGLNWHFGFHALKKILGIRDRQKNREILHKIFNYKIRIDDVFEVYYFLDKTTVAKFGVRIPLNEREDLIFFVDNMKTVITLYTNLKEENHKQLDKSPYEIGNLG
jgi:hypothetical protein